ncbi:hypothetical protein [uncultured Cellulomonas sp.]|uniref:hypothetical protein n=1 Tax=uncultured Cellulomonas sp. TaxID=189682 RepID=UPI0028E4E40B|nr:hypothetical protein [uncultured Cellulomonas sp.]
MTTTTGWPEPTAPVQPAPGWWRRNRWALAALPVALALALVAAGDRVRTLWWEKDLRVPTTAEAGATVGFEQRVYDGAGGTMPIDVQVRLDGVRTATTLPEDMELPTGTRAVQVDLTLSADPDVVLAGCFLAVRDAAGTRYGYVASGWGALQSAMPCVPEGSPGPWAFADPDAPARPGTWSVSPVVVVPEGVEVADVALWWQMPRYVLLEAPS